MTQLNGDAAAVPRIGLEAYHFGRECEAGDTSGKRATAFPSGIAMASTFDVSLVWDVAHSTAIEVRANTNLEAKAINATHPSSSCFGPVSNLVRDSRWGRTNEMVGGESPTLGRVLSRSFTWGIQTGLKGGGEDRMVTTIAKHLNTYAGPEGHGYTFSGTTERFNVNAALTEREWRESYLPAFHGSVEAGVTGFMCSYSAITLLDHPERSYNTPACANKYLLDDVVRNEWNWTGFIMSDAGAPAFVGNVEIPKSEGHWHATNKTFGHRYAKNASDAAIKSLTAGLDLELTCCGAPAVMATIGASVRAGRIDEALIDKSLKRSMPVRFELGAMDPPATVAKNPYMQLDEKNVSTAARIALAGHVGKKAIVLLKNKQATLPLLPSEIGHGKTLCVLGPNANETLNMIGGYVTHHPDFVITPYQGLKKVFADAEVALLPGCSASQSTTACPTVDPALTNEMLSKCAAVVVVLGTTNDARSKNENGDACGCDGRGSVEGECCDRDNVRLPGAQLDLLQMVTKMTAAPVVLVTSNAGMVDLNWPEASTRVGAILHAPFLGMTAGQAIADTISGANAPAGRLPLTYYKNISDIDAMHHEINGTVHADYGLMPTPHRKGRTFR